MSVDLDTLAAELKAVGRDLDHQRDPAAGDGWSHLVEIGDRAVGVADTLLLALGHLQTQHDRLMSIYGDLGLAFTKAVTDFDAAQEIIAGRRVPPTDAEIAAHWQAGGSWLVEGVIVLGTCAEARRHRDRNALATMVWVPINSDGHPCVWPVVAAEDGVR